MRRALEFIRIVDPHDGNISLTNLIMIVVVVKLVLMPEPGIAGLGPLLLALGNYNMKKWLAPDEPLPLGGVINGPVK